MLLAAIRLDSVTLLIGFKEELLQVVEFNYAEGIDAKMYPVRNITRLPFRRFLCTFIAQDQNSWVLKIVAPTDRPSSSNTQFGMGVGVNLCFMFKSIASFWAFSFLTSGTARELPTDSNNHSLYAMDEADYAIFLESPDGMEFPARSW